jgi:putative lipoprotein
MRIARTLLVTLGVTTALTALALWGGNSAMARTADAVTGTVTYLERIALPPNAMVIVRLVDVSRADAPGDALAEQRIDTGGKQVPFAFTLAYDPARIDPRGSYAVQARIEVDGQLWCITTDRYAAITQGNPTQVEVIVRRASGPGLPTTGGGGMVAGGPQSPLMLVLGALLAGAAALAARRWWRLVAAPGRAGR